MRHYATSERFTAADGKQYPLEDVLAGAIRGVASVNFSTEEAVEKAISDATTTVCANLYKFDIKRASLKAFGYIVGRRVALSVEKKAKRDFKRTMRFNPTGNEDEFYATLDAEDYDKIVRSTAGPDEQWAIDESYDRVVRCLDKVSPANREVLEYIADGIKGKELGKLLGCNANGASIRASRARKEFREILDTEDKAA